METAAKRPAAAAAADGDAMAVDTDQYVERHLMTGPIIGPAHKGHA